MWDSSGIGSRTAAVAARSFLPKDDYAPTIVLCLRVPVLRPEEKGFLDSRLFSPELVPSSLRRRCPLDILSLFFLGIVHRPHRFIALVVVIAPVSDVRVERVMVDER